MQNNTNDQQGTLELLCGPSGVGKSSSIESTIITPFTFTTREPRDQEDSKTRLFVSEEEFNQKVQKGEILFPYEAYGESYGFSSEITNALRRGHQIIEQVSQHGIAQRLADYCSDSGTVIKRLFIGSIQDIEIRLRNSSRNQLEKRIRDVRPQLGYFCSNMGQYDEITYNFPKFLLADQRNKVKAYLKEYENNSDSEVAEHLIITYLMKEILDVDSKSFMTNPFLYLQLQRILIEEISQEQEADYKATVKMADYYENADLQALFGTYQILDELGLRELMIFSCTLLRANIPQLGSAKHLDQLPQINSYFIKFAQRYAVLKDFCSNLDETQLTGHQPTPEIHAHTTASFWAIDLIKELHFLRYYTDFILQPSTRIGSATAETIFRFSYGFNNLVVLLFEELITKLYKLVSPENLSALNHQAERLIEALKYINSRKPEEYGRHEKAFLEQLLVSVPQNLAETVSSFELYIWALSTHKRFNLNLHLQHFLQYMTESIKRLEVCGEDLSNTLLLNQINRMLHKVIRVLKADYSKQATTLNSTFYPVYSDIAKFASEHSKYDDKVFIDAVCETHKLLDSIKTINEAGEI